MRPGVLLLAPAEGEGTWSVVEVDADLFDALHLLPGSDRTAGLSRYSSASAALGAAYDVLTLLVEGRCPPMEEHVQETVRAFVSALENKGYDSQTAVKILLDLVDRASIRPPKAPETSRRRACPHSPR